MQNEQVVLLFAGGRRSSFGGGGHAGVDDDDPFVTISHSADESSSAAHGAKYQSRFLVFVALNIWATLSNLLVLVVMCRSRALRRSFGCVVISLASVDLLTSLLVTPMAIYYYYNCANWHFGTVSCVGWVTTNIFLCTASISHHCCIAVNRYMAVARPHQHSQIRMSTTSTLVYRVILPSWSAGFLFAIILGVQATIKPDIVVTINSGVSLSTINATSTSTVSSSTGASFSPSPPSLLGAPPFASCGVVDRPYAIYTSVALLVPLALTLAANIGSIFILRNRLKRRELINVQVNNRRPSEITFRMSESTARDADDYSTAGIRISATSATTPSVIIDNTSPTSSEKIEQPTSHQQQQHTSRWYKFTNFGKLLDLYLAETSGVNDGNTGLSLRKRLSFARFGNRGSRKDLAATIAAVSRISRPTTLSLSGEGEGDSSVAATNSNNNNKGVPAAVKRSRLRNVVASTNIGLNASRGSLPAVQSSIRMDSIKEDEQEAAFDANATAPTVPCDRPHCTCNSNIIENNYASMSSLLFCDEYDAFQDSLFLFSKTELLSCSSSDSNYFNEDDDDDDNDFCSGGCCNHPQHQIALLKQRNSTRRRKTLPRGQSENKPTSRSLVRKRAFSVDLPLRYLFAQKAPLARFESKSSFSLTKIAAGTAPGLANNNNAHHRTATVNRKSSSLLMKRPPMITLPKVYRSSSNSRRNRCNTQPSQPHPPPRSSKGGFRIQSVLPCNLQKYQNYQQHHTHHNNNHHHYPHQQPNDHQDGIATAEVAAFKRNSASRMEAGRGGVVYVNRPELKRQTQLDQSLSPTSGLSSPVCFNRASSLMDVTSMSMDSGSSGNPRHQRLHTPLRQTLSGTSVESNNFEISTCQADSSSKVKMIKRWSAQSSSSSLKHRYSRRWASRRGADNSAIMRFRNRERQAERALILVLFFLICLWLPYFMANLIFGICPSCVSQGLHNFFHIFAVSSTGAINPLVYIFASRDFKKAMLRLCKKRRHFSERSSGMHRGSARMSSFISYNNSNTGNNNPILDTPSPAATRN